MIVADVAGVLLNLLYVYIMYKYKIFNGLHRKPATSATYKDI